MGPTATLSFKEFILTLEEIVTAVEEMLAEGPVPTELLGDLELDDVVDQINNVVSNEMMHLKGLGDDPVQNEEVMSRTIATAALKTFLVGLVIGESRQPGLHVRVSQVELEELALQIIRTGSANFALVGHQE